MPFALFQNENVAQGLQKNSQFKAGVSDYDPPGVPVEQNIVLPGTQDAAASWVYYDIALACVLDSGIVAHRHLPQVNKAADSLASCVITDPDIDLLTGRGVNIISNDQFSDTVQRMAHSVYWFRLYGQAMRIGFQVPIPGLKKVGGVTAIPHDANPQNAWNKIVGNYSGLPLWHAYWSLWYTVAEPPISQQVPPPNLAQHIAGDVKLPDGMQAPFSVPDGDAQSTNPLGLGNIIPG